MVVADPARPVVMAIDDDEGVREALRYALEPEFEVAEAASGPAALEQLARHHVDLVLLDLRMHGMDGVDVLRRLRTAGNQVAVIVLSATAAVPTVVEAMRLGALDYITKPFDLDTLLTRVRAAVSRNTEGQRHPSLALIARDSGVRAAITVVLGDGVRVMSVRTAEEAAVRAQDGGVDVVVVDMPAAHDDAADVVGRVHHACSGARLVAMNVAAGDRRRVADECHACLARPTRLGDVLATIVDQLALAVPGYRPPMFRAHVLRVVEYASAHYTTSLLTGLASSVGASPRHLLRVFREDVGMGVKEYMNRVRVEVAKPLLAAGEKVEAVAQQLGVPSGAYFSRLFHRYTGDRPGSYRTRHDAGTRGVRRA